jgi:carbonic anhydrase
MERLRQRLADRLAAPGAGPATGTLDLQVGTRSAAPATAPANKPTHAAATPAPRRHAVVAAPVAAAAAAASPSLSPAAHAPAQGARKHAATGAHGWGYEGPAGPAAWGGMRPDFGLCASGQRQSPIDIRGGLAVDLEPVRFDYQPSRFAVIDNGHTVQVNLPAGNAVEIGGRRFELQQFHFHRPSEERIDGRQFEMSLHLVHKDAEGRLAVVAVLLAKGPAHPLVQQVWNNLPLEKHEEVQATTRLDPADLLPADRRYYTYMGSLTTPPCSEGVRWVVMRTPVSLTPEQIELFARIYPMNARPAQAAAGRRIMQSQ